MPGRRGGLQALARPCAIWEAPAVSRLHRGGRGAAAASLVRSLFKVRLPDGTVTYAVSSSIRRAFYHERPFTLLSGVGSADALLKYSKNDKLYVFYRPAPPAQ